MPNYLNSENRKRETNINVLYIDDNPNDLFIVQRVVQKTKSNLHFFYLNSVPRGIAYLNHIDEFSNREKFPIPSFVLLDYSIGAHTGPDLLRWMRVHPEFSQTPVAVFSDSKFEGTIIKSYQAGANHFLSKPISIERLEAIISGLEQCLTSSPPSFDLLRGLPEYCIAPADLAHWAAGTIGARRRGAARRAEPLGPCLPMMPRAQSPPIPPIPQGRMPRSSQIGGKRSA